MLLMKKLKPREMKGIEKGHVASSVKRDGALPSQSPFCNDTIQQGACVRDVLRARSRIQSSNNKVISYKGNFSSEVSDFRGHSNQELKYSDKDRWMKGPDELNPDPVTPGIMCEAHMEIRAVGDRERRH